MDDLRKASAAFAEQGRWMRLVALLLTRLLMQIERWLRAESGEVGSDEGARMSADDADLAAPAMCRAPERARRDGVRVQSGDDAGGARPGAAREAFFPMIAIQGRTVSCVSRPRMWPLAAWRGAFEGFFQKIRARHGLSTTN